MDGVAAALSATKAVAKVRAALPKGSVMLLEASASRSKTQTAKPAKIAKRLDSAWSQAVVASFASKASTVPKRASADSKMHAVSQQILPTARPAQTATRRDSVL